MTPSDALALSIRIRLLLAGHDGAVQGAVLADLVSIYLVGHHPAVREEALAAFIEAVRQLTPVSEREIFPDGLPKAWKSQ